MKKEKPPLTSPAPKASEGKRMCRVCPSQAYPTRCTPYHKGGGYYNPAPAQGAWSRRLRKSMITEKTNPTATPVMKAIVWLKRTIINSSFLPGLEVQSLCLSTSVGGQFGGVGADCGLQERPTRPRVLWGESPLPSLARFRRLVYPGHGEVTNRGVLGSKSHGCPVFL